MQGALSVKHVADVVYIDMNTENVMKGRFCNLRSTSKVTRHRFTHLQNLCHKT
jgi:hypothetical protein